MRWILLAIRYYLKQECLEDQVRRIVDVLRLFAHGCFGRGDMVRSQREKLLLLVLVMVYIYMSDTSSWH